MKYDFGLSSEIENICACESCVCTYINIQNVSMCMLYVCSMCVSVCVYAYVHTYVCIYVCMYVCMYVGMCILYVCAYTCKRGMYSPDQATLQYSADKIHVDIQSK